MTVEELIKILEQYPKTTKVFVPDELVNCNALVEYYDNKVVIFPDR
jgi:hypothetical protein